MLSTFLANSFFVLHVSLMVHTMVNIAKNIENYVILILTVAAVNYGCYQYDYCYDACCSFHYCVLSLFFLFSL